MNYYRIHLLTACLRPFVAFGFSLGVELVGFCGAFLQLIFACWGGNSSLETLQRIFQSSTTFRRFYLTFFRTQIFFRKHQQFSSKKIRTVFLMLCYKKCTIYCSFLTPIWEKCAIFVRFRFLRFSKAVSKSSLKLDHNSNLTFLLYKFCQISILISF
jgi:hypothetical protein